MSISYAQKEDRNWVFGFNAGIDFNDLADPLTFKSNSHNYETSASISDSNGKLLFYISNLPSVIWTGDTICIRDGNNSVVTNGLGINIWQSCTNGAIIVPFPNDNSKYYLFHIGEYIAWNQCQDAVCLNLYYSVLHRKANSTFEVTNKNVLTISEPIEERLEAIRHANGQDWWLLVHRYSQSGISCTNTFYKVLVSKNGVQGPFPQDIGSLHCPESSYQGQMVSSSNGELLAIVILNAGMVDLFKFDRCSGQLFDFRLVDDNPLFKPFGCAYSKSNHLLYVSEGTNFSLPIESNLFQYDLRSSNLQASKKTIWSSSDNSLMSLQLQLAPDDKIYLATSFNSSQTLINQANQNLSVINNPDSIGMACNFQPFGFYLGDSIVSMGNLPNMPNYNLGATSIYQADAGADTFTICTEGTTVKGVLLGTPTVAGVTYSWHPADSLNHTNIAQPFANPAQTTMYVVTLTDTSIKYSCQSREDTVWVVVRDCSVGVEAYSSQHSVVRVFPNPADGILNVELEMMNGNTTLQQVEIFDVNGKSLNQQSALQPHHTTLNTQHITNGLYFVKVQLLNGQSIIKKVVVE